MKQAYKLDVDYNLLSLIDAIYIQVEYVFCARFWRGGLMIDLLTGDV